MDKNRFLAVAEGRLFAWIDAAADARARGERAAAVHAEQFIAEYVRLVDEMKAAAPD